MARAASRPFVPSRAKGAPPPPGGKGRGARSALTGRFETEVRVELDDGWSDEAPLPSVNTTVSVEPARKIVTFNNSPYVGFDRSINMYRGCEHGCVYCFARPTHAYLGLSPGLDFETRLFAKPNAAALLRKELSAKRYELRPIAIGTNTDPYQPIERTHHLMRQVLEVLSEFGHPVSILTKSDLVLRDLDLLGPMAEKGLARVMISITTQDAALARAMEPRVPRPGKRMAALSALSAAGVPTGAMHGPLIPGLSCHELEALMTESRERGATYAAYTLLRLPQEVAGLFEEWLEAHAPNAKSRVLRHLREMNGGRIYDARWSRAEEPRAIYARLMRQRFSAAYRKLGFDEAPGLRCDRFAVPREVTPQAELF